MKKEFLPLQERFIERYRQLLLFISRACIHLAQLPTSESPLIETPVEPEYTEQRQKIQLKQIQDNLIEALATEQAAHMINTFIKNHELDHW